MRSTRIRLVIGGLLCGILAGAPEARALDFFFPLIHFVPNSQAFWDNSKNWTTNYGPAYRDTVERPDAFVKCSGRYALCFHSGAEPLPCRLTPGGRFANCTCTVEEGENWVLVSAILNYQVYLDTINACGPDLSLCAETNSAPVCKAINERRFIPGAPLISTFSPDVVASIKALLEGGASSDLTVCPGKDPYAGCMTAPCWNTLSGEAKCSCPVFHGPFQLLGAGALCTLPFPLIPSASYSPALDD
jgi:hypothetical protein